MIFKIAATIFIPSFLTLVVCFLFSSLRKASGETGPDPVWISAPGVISFISTIVSGCFATLALLLGFIWS